MIRIPINTHSLDDYRRFLAVKALPQYRFAGDYAEFPDEYASRLGMSPLSVESGQYRPSPGLWDYQRDITALAIRKRKFAVFADCGLGKGLPPKTKVLTPNGWHAIGSLVAGQLITGADGREHRVTGIFHRGIQKTYRVTFSDGVSIVCDGDHLWKVRSFNDAARGRPWRVLSTDELRNTSLRYGKAKQSRTWEIPLVQPADLMGCSKIIHPYILGVLLGDGSLTTGCVSWCKNDREIADAVSKLLPPGVELSERKCGDKATVWSIVKTHGYRNPIAEELRQLGLMGCRSEHKFVPISYLFSPASDRIALLQGLLDTDGYAGETVEFSSTSAKLADAVVFLVQSLGGTARIACRQQPTYEHNGEKRTGLPCYRVTMTLPPDIRPFTLPRKANAYKCPTRGLGRWIDSIEPAGESETVCIKVDSPDECFVAEDFIVTHNTLVFSEYARHVATLLPPGRCVLLISPPNVVRQTLDQVTDFYGDTLPIERVYAHNLTDWLTNSTARIGITNYEALKETTPQGRLGALILDESSMLKSHYGIWGQICIRLGKGLEWKLAGTGTPAPNDRIEFANHAVFLDHFPTVNSFLARFFVNRGETSERWVLKQHALKAFYLALSHWCIFLNNPATYGWADNTAPLPPIRVNIHRVEMTAEQQGLAYQETGLMFADNIGGIKSRSVLSQIAKGHHRGKDVETKKPAYIRGLVDSWPDESTIIWCLFNHEQELLAKTFPEAVSITGQTPDYKRQQWIDDFKTGRKRILISKPKILGLGLNLQIATRQVFSGLQDSYEQYYQAVKRSNRYGSKKPLNVHIPIADIERPMIETVLAKAKRVQQDTEEQERIFREMTHDYIEFRTDSGGGFGTPQVSGSQVA